MPIQYFFSKFENTKVVMSSLISTIYKFYLFEVKRNYFK